MHALELAKQQNNDLTVARILRRLSDTNRLLELYEEGVHQAKDALEIYKCFDDAVEQAICLKDLAFVLIDDGKFDAAEAAISEAINLIPTNGQDHLACVSYRVLGDVYRMKGEKEKAIHHFEMALEIASPFDWHDELFWNHLLLAVLFRSWGEFDESNVHIGHARSHVAHNAYSLGLVTEKQAEVWQQQQRLEDAMSEALRALEIFERLGAAGDAERCGDFIRSLSE